MLALRPLSTGDVFLVLLVGIAVWWLSELAQRRPGEVVDGPQSEAGDSGDPKTAETESASIS